ncbi:uncharacterized protein LOC113346774 isoform X2 [Papaver somniferum]|uniref:uncharacterized protein LOC113346774 isoform X2 n=1 Tax=Papaver somniferum TaxID=3469 RepID=UPI000E704C85|nr:uncharacterized protein LOC113346774 isoform X2 [Papaver somniferum]
MITRPKLAEQLREYQIRSKHDWASVSFFTSTANFNSTSRVDVLISVAWELIILAVLVFSAVSLYFRIPFSHYISKLLIEPYKGLNDVHFITYTY